MSSHVRRALIAGAAAAVFALLPPTAPASAVTDPVAGRTGGTVLQASHRCPRVEPWTGVVQRCTAGFGWGRHRDLLTYDGVWAPHFEPALNGIGRTGSYFVYVGRTPVGWVDLHATLGGTITLVTEHGEYRKGLQRIALYNPRGKLVAWDWIVLDWDW